MPLALARILIDAVVVYAVLGAAFAVPFHLRGLRRVDPASEGSTWGFHVAITPGVVTLWPLLLGRWVRGVTSPPAERTAHRRPVSGSR